MSEIPEANAWDEFDHGPQIPETYWSRRPESMAPDEIVFPTSYHLVIDKQTNATYLKADMTLGSDVMEWRPRDYDPRFGLLRVYGYNSEWEFLDGYIADIRSLGDKHIDQRDITSILENEKYMRDMNAERGFSLLPPLLEGQREFAPLLGVIYNDPEGNMQYASPRREATKAHAEYLANTMDEIVAAYEKTGDRYAKIGITDTESYQRLAATEAAAGASGAQMSEPNEVAPDPQPEQAAAPSTWLGRFKSKRRRSDK